MRLTPLSKRIEKRAALGTDWREKSKGGERKRQRVEGNIVGGWVISENEI